MGVAAVQCGWLASRCGGRFGRSNEYNHYFWKKFRQAVKDANPNALILAEHYGDPGEWLQGDEWDTVMNYDAFMEPITWFLTGMEKHSDEAREELLGNADNFVGGYPASYGEYADAVSAGSDE